MAGIGDIRLRDVGEYVGKNFKFTQIPQYVAQAFGRYQNKYVNIRNARITPFFHCAAVCMVMNYMIAYKYFLKYEKHRKYH